MKWVRFALLVLFTALLQASVLIDIISISRFRIEPNLLLILLVYFAIHAEPAQAIIASFSIGLAADMASGMLGPNILAFGLCGSILSSLRRVIAVKSMFSIVIWVFASAVCVGIVVSILGAVKGHESLLTALCRYLGSSVYSSLLAPYVFILIALIAGSIGVKRYSARTGT